jgi:hypothetical protein
VSVLAVRRESISSIKTTEGWCALATAKSARTIFSPSPTHLDVSVEALMEKNVERIWDAMHLPEIKRQCTDILGFWQATTRDTQLPFG